jgi:hypothetical protein
LAIAIAAIALAAPARAAADTTVTIATDADARVQQATPDQNSGRGSYLRTDGGTDPAVESYLHFTVSGLVGPVVSASLQLFTTTDGSAHGPSAYGTTNGWTETGITWNNRPGRTTGALDTPATAPPSTWVSFNVTSFVTGDGAYSFDLATTSTDGVNFNSRESGTNVPRLIVTTASTGAPVPVTGQASQVASAGATLNGTLNPGGQAATYHFDYGTDATYGLQTSETGVPAGTSAVPVAAALTGLAPATTYHFRLVGSNASGIVDGADQAFTTPSDTTVTVAVAGDIACPLANSCVSGARATAAVLPQIAPQALLVLGDEQYWSGTTSEFAAYDSTWGRYKSITYPAVGNHEYVTPGATGYYGYFGASAGDPAKGYYSFDLGAWHLISLNSECSQIGGCGAGSPQATWLQADLAAHAAPCTLAFWHRPRFVSNTQFSDGNFQTFWNILYAAGADVILNGHFHAYERFAPQNPQQQADPSRGIREFVVGTGGEGLFTFDEVLPNSEVREDTTFGVLGMTLSPFGYSWRFYPTAGSTFTDTGTGTCH